MIKHKVIPVAYGTTLATTVEVASVVDTIFIEEFTIEKINSYLVK